MRMGVHRSRAIGLGAVVVILAAVACAASLGALHSGSGAAAAPAARGDGITVHGQWTIQVRRPDGGVVTTRRFHNDLVTQGAQALVDLLGRQIVPGLWRVTLSGDAWTTNSVARIDEPASTIAGTNYFKNLVVSEPSSGPDAGKLVLAGDATGENDGSLDGVYTGLQRCSTTVAPGTDCGAGAYALFTLRNLNPVVALVAGQKVLVTVRLTFS